MKWQINANTITNQCCNKFRRVLLFLFDAFLVLFYLLLFYWTIYIGMSMF